MSIRSSQWIVRETSELLEITYTRNFRYLPSISHLAACRLAGIRSGNDGQVDLFLEDDRAHLGHDRNHNISISICLGDAATIPQTGLQIGQ